MEVEERPKAGVIPLMDTRFLRAITLVSVHMHSCSHERGPGEPTVAPTVETDGEFQRLRGLADDHLGYLVKLSYKILNTESNEPVAQGEVVYVVTYALDDGTTLSDEQVETFGRQGALFQVHPYLREHVATMCQRSGLVPYPLPMLIHDPSGESTDEAVPVDGR